MSLDQEGRYGRHRDCWERRNTCLGDELHPPSPQNHQDARHISYFDKNVRGDRDGFRSMDAVWRVAILLPADSREWPMPCLVELHSRNEIAAAGMEGQDAVRTGLIGLTNR
jgi:hypothetical protein